MRRYFIFILIAVALATPMALFEIGGSAPVSAAPNNNNRIPGQYIVTLKAGERPVSVANRFRAQDNINIKHTYEHVLNGFSARIPDKLVEKLRKDPAVLSIVEDQKISIASDSRPSGIRRSEADRNAISQIGSHTNPIAVDVAVIDTGIDGDHPDLNVVGGINCVVGETSWEDLHGHGTHVAGTIGALDNGSGVVGVAPGARLWAVRVLNADGEGEFSDAICGIDWITANAHILEVANMSLGGEGATGTCTDGGFRQAVCESVEAGVTYVVAAGNSGVNADTFVPASFPEVITVSALADTDGRPGGDGPSSFFYGADDTLATFSNYGPAVDIAAPGVNIQSTWINGSYNTISGTSMASPHVAGAAAIYLSQNPSASPAAVRSHILAEAWPQSSPQGFTGDVDNDPEPLLNAGTIGGLDPLPPPPPPPSGCSLTSESGTVGSQTTLNCTGYEPYEWVWIHWDSLDQPSRGLFIASNAGEGSFNLTVPDAAYGEHAVIARGSTTGIEANLTFFVEPSLQITNDTGTVGSFVTMYAKGFAANETIDLRWHSGPGTFEVLKTVTTSSTGRATIYTHIPDGPGGAYTVEAVGSTSGVSKTGSFTIIPGMKLATFWQVGSNFSVSVSGFQSGESIELRWAGQTVTSSTADQLGKASLVILVPESPTEYQRGRSHRRRR
ncbi:MAG: S8 family peptidase [Thermomicrobiales bacterium]